MKILHISRTMGQGGAEKVVYQLCKDNEEMTPIIASTGGAYEEKLQTLKIKHYKIPDIDKKNVFLMLKTLFILRKIIKKEKIEVVHSHHRMAAFYSKILSYFMNFKRVYTAHNVFYNKKRLLKLALSGSKIVAVGEGVKQNLIDVYSIAENNIEVIYNAVEKKEKLNEPLEILVKLKNKGNILIGNIGRLSEQKGMDVFLKALKKVVKKQKNVVGVIIGDGEKRSELEMLTKELNLLDNVVFLGFQDDVFSIINQLDFVVLSSRWEGFPLTPIEVFSMQKTIIASNISGTNEIVINESNGLLFEKDNVDELSEKILYLISNKKNREKMAKKALEDYNFKYSYTQFLKKYNDLYDNL